MLRRKINTKYLFKSFDFLFLKGKIWLVKKKSWCKMLIWCKNAHVNVFLQRNWFILQKALGLWKEVEKPHFSIPFKERIWEIARKVRGFWKRLICKNIFIIIIFVRKVVFFFLCFFYFLFSFPFLLGGYRSTRELS